MPEQKIKVSVGGRELALSNLDKVLYPASGFTKRDVLHYYASIGPYLLPHIAGRPLTFKRYPDGVDGKFFFEKQVPKHAPEWIDTAHVPSSSGRNGRDFVDYPVLNDIAALTWAANLASLELHTPLWRMGDGEPPCPPDLMVLDLDPGPPATIVDCCEVALMLAPALEEEGFEVHPKTSGSKGLQLYMPIEDWSWEQLTKYANELAKRMEKQEPTRIVSRMTKSLRDGKVLIDWSQNVASKTTISVYSLRAREHPTVSTPVHWEEVMACAKQGDPELLRFEASEVIERVERFGDLFESLAPAHRDQASA